MDDRKILKDFQRIKSFAFKDFAGFGYPDEQLEKEFLSWNIKDGNVNHLKDSIWFFYNRLISEFPRDFRMQSQIYWDMAIFDFQYGNRKTVDMMKKLSADAKIKYFESTHKDHNILQYEGRILVSKNSCAVCMEDADKKFTVTQLFQSHPLPHENCTCAGIGCTCMVAFEARRNNGGKLIFNLDSFPTKKEAPKSSSFSNNIVRAISKSVSVLFGLNKKAK